MCSGVALAPSLYLGTQHLTEATVLGGVGVRLQAAWVRLCLLTRDRACLPRDPETGHPGKKAKLEKCSPHRSSSFHPVEVATFPPWNPLPLPVGVGGRTLPGVGVVLRLLTLAATQLRPLMS